MSRLAHSSLRDALQSTGHSRDVQVPIGRCKFLLGILKWRRYGSIHAAGTLCWRPSINYITTIIYNKNINAPHPTPHPVS